MLRLLFICRCQPSHDAAQIKAIQRDIWRRCTQKKIGGFLVRTDHTLVGLFEGPEKIVIGQVEHLIRKHKVQAVQVLRENAFVTRDWPTWQADLEVLADVPVASSQNLAGLAQNDLDAVEGIQRKS